MTKTRKRIFTKKDYSSGDGMMTKIWGPPTWFFLHIVSFNYPIHPTNQEKQYYRNLILNLQYTLPCKYCRLNLQNNLKKIPLTMEHMQTRETFSRYVYNLHEMVNKMLNKSSGLSYAEVREKYEHFRSRCTDPPGKVFDFKTQKGKKEKGCTEPLYGKKSKCILSIVPIENRSITMKIDRKCMKRRA